MSVLLPDNSKILFITATPLGEERLDTDRELRAIREAVRGKFNVVPYGAARPQDLIQTIQQEKPAVVHFSGHGTGKEGLVLQQDDGTAVLFTSEMLTALLAAEELMAPVRLMVLNACFTHVQAEVIAQQGPDTIAMKRDVLDKVAVAFAEAYYRALSDNLSIRGALPAAFAALVAQGLPEADTPVFFPGTKRAAMGASATPTVPERTINRIAFARFLAGLQEDDWSDVVFENAAFSREHARMLNNIGRKEAARTLIVWVEGRHRMSLEPLIRQVREILPERYAEAESTLYPT